MEKLKDELKTSEFIIDELRKQSEIDQKQQLEKDLSIKLQSIAVDLQQEAIKNL